MKILSRLMGFTAIGLLFIGILMNIMQENILLRDLVEMTSLAVNQTQIVMKEQIEDQYYNYVNARIYFNSNEEYYDYFKQCFSTLITSDARYESILYDIDYTKGLISVGIDCKYKNIAGIDKVLHTRKTSIVDVLIDADVSESTIPDLDLQLITPPTITLSSFDYDGSEHILSSPGACSGGTFYYGYSTSSTITPTNYSTQLPKGIDAGVYSVWFKIKSAKTGNFEYETCIGTSTINPRTITIEWGEDNWVYSGLPRSTNVIVGNTIASDNVSVELENNSITNVGSKIVIAKATTNSNYVLPVGDLTHTIRVSPALVQVFPYDLRMMYSETMPYRYEDGYSPEERITDDTYIETEHRITGFSYYATGLVADDVLYGSPSYELKTQTGDVLENYSSANVGTYLINVSGLYNNNYQINYNSGHLVINKLKNYLQPASLWISCEENEPYCTISSDYYGLVTNYYGDVSYHIVSAIKNDDGIDYKAMLGHLDYSHGDIRLTDISPWMNGRYNLVIKATCMGDINHESDETTIEMMLHIQRQT